MKLILALTLLCVCQILQASPADRADKNPDYEAHKKQFHLKFKPEEEAQRQKNFEKAHEIITKHNADPTRTSKLAHNEYSTHHEHEIKAMRGAIVPKHTQKNREMVAPDVDEVDERSYPASLDWRAYNGVNYLSPIQNQGQCGSCWTFSATATLESRWAIVNQLGSPPKLSEQNIVDCAHSGNSDKSGCSGGWYTTAWDYVASSNGNGVGEITGSNSATLPKSQAGQDTESSYPYQAVGGTCDFNSANVAAWTSSYSLGNTQVWYTNSLYYTNSASYEITASSPSAMKKALQSGPISVAIDANGEGFMQYKSGTWQADQCGTSLDHAVNVIGYGSDENGDYWLMRNSWATTWGIDGYMKFERTDEEGSAGTCGVQLKGAYPNVKSEY